MAQFSKGDTFVDGQQVTASRLNQLVDASQALVGLISDQTAVTANTLEATDGLLINDAGTLKKATISDILNSNLPVTTSSITGGSGVDIVVSPASGQKFDVNGAFESTTSNTTGNATIGGSLTVTGGSTLTGNVVADNGFTSNGVANFTGAFQVNGSVGFVLTEIIDEPVSPSSPITGATTWTDLFTSASYTKPVGEVWFLELDATFYYQATNSIAIRLIRSSDSSSLDLTTSVEQATASYFHHEKTGFKAVFDSASSFTSTFKVQGFGGGATINFAPSGNWVWSSYVQYIQPKFRIYKYKTA